MKTLNDLFAIEQKIEPETLKERFFKEGTDMEISKERINVLTASPFLITRAYGEFQRMDNRRIPEEANAFLIGQKNLLLGKPPLEIYSAVYCNVRDSSKEIKRYRFVECNHRICDCHMELSEKGDYFKYAD